MLASLIGLVVLVPLWLDPMTLNELRNVTPQPVASASLQVSSPIPALATFAAPATIVAEDSYERAVSVGLGAADPGGDYEISGAAEQIAVIDGAATLELASGESGVALLPLAQGQQLDLTVVVDASSRPAAGEVRLALLLRRLDDGSEYRATLHMSAAESSLSIEVSSPAGTRTIAGPILLPDAGRGQLQMRAIVEGSDPATIRLRAWMATDPEPAYWHMSVVDWTGSLQDSGSLGIGWSLDDSPSSRPTTLRFDDLLATSTDGVDR